jgi:hypothetical protein
MIRNKKQVAIPKETALSKSACIVQLELPFRTFRGLGIFMKIVKVFAVSVMLAAMSVQLAFATHTWIPGEEVRGAPDNGRDFGECLSNFNSEVEWTVVFFGTSFSGTGIGSLAALGGGANPEHLQAYMGWAKDMSRGEVIFFEFDPDWTELSCDADGPTLLIVFE